MCVHPVLSGKAYKKIEKSVLEEVVVTDSIPLRQKSDKFTVLSIDRLFATVIESVIANRSINTLFDFEHFLGLDDTSFS
jgi:ribose-phosphate pyrophosphokinase